MEFPVIIKEGKPFLCIAKHVAVRRTAFFENCEMEELQRIQNFHETETGKKISLMKTFGTMLSYNPLSTLFLMLGILIGGSIAPAEILFRQSLAYRGNFLISLGY